MNLLPDTIPKIGKLSIGLLASFALSVGCVQSESVQDSSTAEICMQHAESQNGEHAIVAGEPLEVFVMICGFSNWESVETWCEAEVSGQEILISSRFDYEYQSGDAHALCYSKVAECELPALSEETYTVIHGDAEKELIVPADSDNPLDCSSFQGHLP